jgi:DNA-binding HxlR family transcriptional regulator
MKNEKKQIISREVSIYRKLEDVVGCKWSVSVLLSINSGTNRPGALERSIDGISKKVLSERLRKLTSYGLLEKHSFPEVPPRTEYSLTPSGKKLIKIIQQIQSLDAELSEGKT